MVRLICVNTKKEEIHGVWMNGNVYGQKQVVQIVLYGHFTDRVYIWQRINV